MKKENKELLESIVMALAVALVFSLAFSCSSCTHEKETVVISKDEYYNLRYMAKRADIMTDLAISSNDLLHRVWIDRPTYVEDALMESEEFAYADSLRESDWEDTFEFWNDSDSIAYYKNREVEQIEAMAVLKHYAKEPDKLVTKRQPK